MTLRIETIPLGELMTNGFLVVDGGEAWVVDPGFEPAPLLERLGGIDATVSRILLTHGHCDHVAGVGAVKERCPDAVITAPAGDAEMPADAMANLSRPFGMDVTAPRPEALVSPGEELTCGGSAWRVLDTAGHTPGGVSYYCPAEAVAIVGDALFAGGVGRTDLPGASGEQLIANIKQNLLTLPDETSILPGHGPGSTIGIEKAQNPWLR